MARRCYANLSRLGSGPAQLNDASSSGSAGPSDYAAARTVPARIRCKREHPVRTPGIPKARTCVGKVGRKYYCSSSRSNLCLPMRLYSVTPLPEPTTPTAESASTRTLGVGKHDSPLPVADSGVRNSDFPCSLNHQPQILCDSRSHVSRQLTQQ